MRNFSLSFASLLLLASTAQAQDNSYLSHRLDRLERDIQFLQKEFYNEDPNAPRGVRGAGGGADTASLSVDLQNLQRELQIIRGDIEKVEHQHSSLKRDITSMEQNFELRVQALEARSVSAVNEGSSTPPTITGSAPAVPTVTGTAPRVNTSRVTPDVNEYTPNPREKRSENFDLTVADEIDLSELEEEEQLELEKDEPTSKMSPVFDRPREHYNHAFGLMDKKKYDDAIRSFKAFIQRYPDEELLGHAYYWLGEAYYAKGQSLDAADTFRQGFEEMPEGPKAPDNLFKLSKSLKKLDKKQEACVVLTQILKKYENRQTPVKDKAEAEIKTLGCD